MDVQISITHGKNYMHLGTEHSWYAELLFDSRHVLILSPSWEGTKEITAVGSLLDPDGSKLKFKVLKAAGTEIKNPGRREKLRSEPHILHHCFSCFSWGICQLTAAIGRLRNWRQSIHVVRSSLGKKGWEYWTETLGFISLVLQKSYNKIYIT